MRENGPVTAIPFLINHPPPRTTSTLTHRKDESVNVKSKWDLFCGSCGPVWSFLRRIKWVNQGQNRITNVESLSVESQTEMCFSLYLNPVALPFLAYLLKQCCASKNHNSYRVIGMRSLFHEEHRNFKKVICWVSVILKSKGFVLFCYWAKSSHFPKSITWRQDQ